MAISNDPIGFSAGDANLYRYVGNQVTTNKDPSGLIDPDVWSGREKPKKLALKEFDRDKAYREYWGFGRFIVRQGALSDTIRDEYLGRAAGGCFVVPQLAARATGVRMKDDGSIAGETALTRNEWLIRYAVTQGVPADGQFHKVTVPKWTNIFDSIPQTSVSNFWISTPHTLDAAGTYEIRIDRASTPGIADLAIGTVRNTNLRWRLTDRIDANSARQFHWTGGGFGQVLAGCFEVTLGDLLGDKTLGASFDIQIFFEDMRPEERIVFGPVGM